MSTDTGSTLNLLEKGAKARISRIFGSGATRRRIMDMGLVPGAIVELERVAPLGDPIEVKVRDFCLSLRKSEARNIYVEII